MRTPWGVVRGRNVSGIVTFARAYLVILFLVKNF